MKNVSLQNIQVMGANKDSIKISYNGIDYVKFKDLDFIEKVIANRTKNIIFYGRPALNVWMGKISVQYLVSDYEFEEDKDKYEF